jgi:plastocyanin
MTWKLSLTLLAAALMAGCGPRKCTRPPGFYITISSRTFSPANLSVPPGATVTVVNDDSLSHSVTSEEYPGSFTPGAVSGISFDTGVFTGDQSFTVAAGAPDGAVVPYYCTVHKGMMSPPNGTITISASAQPGPGPTGCAGRGGGY